ncbi:elastase-like [Babylonia areolata]|uniref:elastase-like n=1 Tax=Babylonia areolata TaxID=304850 RepID=UPI003FD5E94D
MWNCLLLLFLWASLAPHSQGAQRVSAKSLLQHAMHRRHVTSQPVTSYRFKRNADVIPMTEMDDVMALERDANLQLVQETLTVQGTKVLKMQERYKGRVIPDAVVTLETDHDGRHVLDASGNVYRNIDLDFEKVSQLGPEEATRLCMQHNQDDMASPDSVLHEKMEEEVLFEDDGEAYPAYLVQYLVSLENEMQRRPTCLIDARNSSIIVSWDAIDTCSDCTATGVGGNLKVGKIRYGEFQRCLDLRRDNGTCYLENRYVRVLNNNFSFSEKSNATPVASYNCEEIDDYVNGGYSPLLDAFFYGTVVSRMFEDWYGMSPLGKVITFIVHFGINESTAFWNGLECVYGDGNGVTYYPFVELNVVGHEIAHGITENNSKLLYFQQSGSVNEAFSDMTGETAQAYLKGADWLVGFEISVGDTPPHRYFDDPEKDNKSISHADNFTDFLDPHLGSGVYNHAFYILVHDYGLPIREVYHVFLHANRMYWHHMSNYVQAACDVMKSAYDLGQDGSKFRQAFVEVGIEVCDVEDHVMGLRNNKEYSDIKVSRAISPNFVFGVPGEFAESVTVNSSSSSGDVYIILSDKEWGSVENNVQVYAEGLHSVTYELPENRSTHISITLTTDSVAPLNDVTLVAVYNCVENFTMDLTNETSVFHYYWETKCAVKREKDEKGESQDNDESEEDNRNKDDAGEEQEQKEQEQDEQEQEEQEREQK